MKVDKYIKFLLTLFIVWLYLATFIVFRIILRSPIFEKNEQKVYKILDTSTGLTKFNQITGETYYFNRYSGGWVKISDTGLVTTSDWKNAKRREEILNKWYSSTSFLFKKYVPKEVFEEHFKDLPTWVIEEEFEEFWKASNIWEINFINDHPEIKQNIPAGDLIKIRKGLLIDVDKLPDKP